jgi:hypothetical protein
MGHVVKLQFECDDPRKLKLLLCSLPHFSAYDPETRQFCYRGAAKRRRRDEMPDAFIKIEAGGLDFWACGTPETVQEIYDYLKKRIALEFGQQVE